MATWSRALVLGVFLLSGCVPAVAAPAASALSVTAVVPEPNASAVLFDTTVYVQFNHPVVPLTTLDHPVPDQPLQVDPPLDGTGKWISTGLFTFTPTPGWAPETTYRLSLPQLDYRWSFSTLPAAVASTVPPPSAQLVDPAAAVRVTFNQPLDHTTVQLTLTPEADGHVDWMDQRTLVFTPNGRFAEDTQYAARVSTNGHEHAWTFRTAPPPIVTSSVPQANQEAPRLGQVELTFSAPMDHDDVRTKLTIEPTIDYPPYLNWTGDDTHVTVFASFKPSTDYALTLAAGTTDRFGRQIAAPFRLDFTTPASQVSPNAPPVTPSMWLVGPGFIGTYDAYEQPRALVRTTNVSHLDYSLDRLDESVVPPLFERLKAMPTTLPDGERVLSDGQDVDFERNVPTLTEVDLGQLAPGYYRLRLEPKERAAPPQDRLVVVTRTMLAVKQSPSQLLVWAADLHTGGPLGDVSVRAFRPGEQSPFTTGVTDANGTVQLAAPVSAAGEPTIVLVDREDDVALALSTWSGGIGPWSFGLQADWRTNAYIANVYTDRPIYRPGQTVHLKGIVRADDDAHYSLPGPGLALTWRARDSRGQIVVSKTLGPLSDFGTFAEDLDLNPEGVTGTYSVQLESGLSMLGSANFVVADYQRPTYEVNVESPASVVAGQPLQANARAAYYFGQPLAGADVHWQVTSRPFAFTWTMDPTFHFGDSDQRVTLGATRPRTEGKSVTGADGGLSFNVPTDLSSDSASQRFTLEATVTDKDSGDVSNRTSVVVHKAGLYVGLKPTSFVSSAGKRQSIETVTAGTDGTPRPNVALRGQVMRRRWISARERQPNGDLQWVSKPEDTPVSEFEAHTGVDGRGSFQFTPDDGGQYRIIVEAPDGIGNTARSAIGVWVADSAYVPWRIADDGRLELQADKQTYRPGDVAHVLVPAPVERATAMVSVERGKVISYRVEQLTGNSTVLDIPIKDEHVPNAYVSVVLFDAGDKPTLWSGYVELRVESQVEQVQVSLAADADEHQPGDDMDVTVQTRDASGSGVPAELSLAMVDAAVLALADSRTDPVDAFWHRRAAGVRTGSSLGVSIDHVNDAVASGLKGGGGGESASVRQDFPDTAHWAANVRTDTSGMAHVRIHLPDSLTTWRLTAVAVTQDTRVGVGTADVLTTRPLLIRPIVPRFMVGGDVVILGAALHNTTSKALAVRAALRATSLIVDDSSPRNTIVPPNGQVALYWRVRSEVGRSGQATLHFEASTADGVQDAVELPMPVLAWGVPTTVATAGEVAAADTTSETVDVPRDVDRQRGELKIQVSASLAAALRSAAEQVEVYPYLCLEQTVSRVLVGANQASGLQRIYRLQHADGGWGLWENDASSPYFTAYALFGLQQVRDAGYAVDQAVIDRGVGYLRAWLNSDPSVYGLDGRAFVLYVLGTVGAREPNRASALFDRRADLSALGKALLARALAASDPGDNRIGGLLAELTSLAVVSATGSHWEEPNQSVRPWLLATEVRTTAAVLDALVRLQPGHPLITPTARWMMAQRTDAAGAWISTHDSAMAFVALTDYMNVSGELEGNFAWQLAVNGRPMANANISDAGSRAAQSTVAVPVPDMLIGPNRVELTRTAGPGRLYYTLQFRSYSPAEDIPFLSHGFTLAREYLTPGGDPIGDVHVGDLVQVRVTLLAPGELHDVLIEDPLPAGLDPVDTRLKTTSRTITPTPTAPYVWSHVDVRADHVALFANYVRSGTYTYVYMTRASVAGDFRILPTNGREQYFPDVQAHSDGRQFTVLP